MSKTEFTSVCVMYHEFTDMQPKHINQSQVYVTTQWYIIMVIHLYFIIYDCCKYED